jgi:single-strand DNA-binding protein
MLNLVFAGHLGRDPEMRFTPDGTPVTNFSVAVNRSYRNSDGERVDQVTWLRVTCWGRLAETTNEYLKKGREVIVEANRLDASAWLSAEGEARASLEVTARGVRFCGTGDGENAAAAAAADDAGGEDIPF